MSVNKKLSDIEISPESACRIGNLHDPKGLDMLLDTLEEWLGIPMGSDTWAQQAAARIRALLEAEKTLHTVSNCIEEIKDIVAGDMTPLFTQDEQNWADDSRERKWQRDGG